MADATEEVDDAEEDKEEKEERDDEEEADAEEYSAEVYEAETEPPAVAQPAVTTPQPYRRWRTTTTPPLPCIDLTPECIQKAYLCSNAFYFPIMQRNCRLTCGFCRPVS